MIIAGCAVKLTDRMAQTMTRGCAPMRRTTRGVDWAARRGVVVALAANQADASVIWEGTKVPQYWPLRALEVAHDVTQRRQGTSDCEVCGSTTTQTP